MIRKAKIDDYRVLVKLFIEENKHNASLASDVVNRTIDVLTEDELQEILLDGSQVLYVAENNGAVVGLLLGNVVKVEGKRWTQSRCYGYIEELVVTGSSRGQGLAKKLVSQFERWAKSCGAASIELHVWSNNVIASGFYDRVGFASKQCLLSKQL